MLPLREYRAETRNRKDASVDPNLLEEAEVEGAALEKERIPPKLSANSTKQAVVNMAMSASSVTEGEVLLQLDAKTLGASLIVKVAQPLLPSLLDHRREGRVPGATNRVNPRSALQRSRREAKFPVPILPEENASSVIAATTPTLQLQHLLLVVVRLVAKVVNVQRARRKRQIRRAVAPQPLLSYVLWLSQHIWL